MAAPPELPAEVIRAAARGEARAREAVARRYAGPLCAFVRRAGVTEPEDATQELLARLLEALPGFRTDGPATLSTFAFTLAHRYVIDVRRRRHLTLVPLDSAELPEDGAPSPERDASARAELARVEAAIAALPESFRRALLLVQVHGQPLEAVAELEGVPVGTIKSRLFRARAALAAARLSHEGGRDDAVRR